MDTSKLPEFFSVNNQTGEIKRIKKTSSKTFIGQTVGCKRKDGYLVMRFNNKLELCHRVAYFLYHGELPTEIDHINGNRSDNSVLNIRSVTRSENNANHKKKSTNKSGHCGVYWMKSNSKWAAEIKMNGIKERLGYFVNIDDAVAARKKAEVRLGFTDRHGN